MVGARNIRVRWWLEMRIPENSAGGVADDAVGLQVQCGEQRHSSISFVVTGAALHLSRPLGSGSRHSNIMAP